MNNMKGNGYKRRDGEELVTGPTDNLCIININTSDLTVINVVIREIFCSKKSF